MKKEILNLRISALICGLILFCSVVFAEGDIHVLKISAQDQRAVVKMGDGKLQVIKVGDSIEKAGAVVEITAGRIVFEEQTEHGTERVIIQLENGRQKVERLKKDAGMRPTLLAPSAKEVKNKSK